MYDFYICNNYNTYSYYCIYNNAIFCISLYYVEMAGRDNFPSVTNLTTREFNAVMQTTVAAIQWAKLHRLLTVSNLPNLQSPMVHSFNMFG